MKIRNWIVSVLAILFVFGCGGGDDSGSGSSTPPAGVTQDEKPTGITANLVVPEDFDFKSEREVKVELSVANSQYSRGFLSVYTDMSDGTVDYNSQVIRTPVTNGESYNGVVMLPNHQTAIWVEVWYPEDLDAVIKKKVDVVDGVASAQL
ncbi:hypothetical protein KIV40_18405 [Vibrio sp. D173a]|uniref:hypothetical protein n=1 Tax=Vibrio sp. D173a TaxID=2836349 RepID=UPI002557B9C2|nr:hypothetical protein [Vibrio sp. D173a]MDK9757313.1 hypothetical protein [Vibrio sp. D173a]